MLGYENFLNRKEKRISFVNHTINQTFYPNSTNV
jgi:hypothetical protein